MSSVLSYPTAVMPFDQQKALSSMMGQLEIADRREDQDSSSQRCVVTTSMKDEPPTMVTSPSSISFGPTEEGTSSIGTGTVGGSFISEKEMAHQKEIQQLQALARQIEYYFSKQNLEIDTYLQTLRNLNDGCVPVSILANFAKVKAILTPGNKGSKPKVPVAALLLEEESRIHAVLQAVNEYTEVLQIHSIDTATGKITTDETPSSALTILAVGSPDPRSTVRCVTSPSSAASSLPLAATSTIILRDVDPLVQEEEVRSLLERMDNIPTTTRVVSDVANCW